MDFSIHFEFKIAQIWEKLAVTMVAHLHNKKFSRIIFFAWASLIARVGSFYRPSNLLCWDPQSKGWAYISLIYERPKPTIGLAIQGIWRPLDLYAFLMCVRLGGNQSWQKPAKEYKPAMYPRILLQTQKYRSSIARSSTYLPVKKPTDEARRLPWISDYIILSYSVRSQTD